MGQTHGASAITANQKRKRNMARWAVFANTLTLELKILSEDDFDPDKYLPMSPDWRKTYEEAETDLKEIQYKAK